MKTPGGSGRKVGSGKELLAGRATRQRQELNTSRDDVKTDENYDLHFGASFKKGPHTRRMTVTKKLANETVRTTKKKKKKKKKRKIIQGPCLPSVFVLTFSFYSSS